MDALQPVLLSAFVVLIALVFIGWPLITSRRDARQERVADAHIAGLKQRADLLNERRDIYAAIRDLEMEYRVDKVNEDEFSEQRDQLVTRAAAVLEQLDALQPPAHDPVEEMIDAFKNGQPPVPATAAQFCPNCGERTQPNDLYCGNCGHALS